MKLLCLVIILSSTTLFARELRPYIFHYTDKDIKLSRENFKRYARPQARGIVQDFFLTLKRVQPIQSELIEIMTFILSIERDWKETKKICQETKEKCLLRLKQAYQQSRNLEKVLLTFQKNKLSLKRENKFPQYDRKISLSHSLDQLLLINYQILHSLEESIVISGTPYFVYTQSTKKMTPLLHRMLLRSEMIIISQLKQTYRKDFELVWNDFIKPLDKYILRGRSIDYLLSNLESLNTSWNTFHMRMSKTNKSLPKTSLSTINYMHTRWNLILKTILRK